MTFKSVKYHLIFWSKVIYEKICHIHPWITWYIRAGHGILCLGSLNLIQYVDSYSNKSPFKYHISVLGGVGILRPCLFCLFRGGPEFGTPAYIILEWQFVQICIVYRIKFKLPKHKIPCPGLIYKKIQGYIWLIFSYIWPLTKVMFHRLKSHFQVYKNFDPFHKQYKHFASWPPNPLTKKAK